MNDSLPDYVEGENILEHKSALLHRGDEFVGDARDDLCKFFLMTWTLGMSDFQTWTLFWK